MDSPPAPVRRLYFGRFSEDYIMDSPPKSTIGGEFILVYTFICPKNIVDDSFSGESLLILF